MEKKTLVCCTEKINALEILDNMTKNDESGRYREGDEVRLDFWRKLEKIWKIF
jgi:hypothetical protein